MAVTLPTDHISSTFTIGTLIGGPTGVLSYVYTFAGLAMMLMLIWGGIILMTAAGNPKKSAEGYGKITASVIGFVIIFIAYIVAQLVQVLLGVKFL